MGSKPQQSKRRRDDVWHGTTYTSSEQVTYDRRDGALREALRYLRMDPPRITLAKQAIKAALDPEAPRWDD